MSMSGFALFFWLVISVSSVLTSGSVYFRIQNHWIYLVPLLIFGVAWSISLNLTSRWSRSPSVQRLNYQSMQDVEILFSRLHRILLPFLLMMLLSVSVVAYKVSATLGISFFAAQELRGAFYENLTDFGGVYFIWATWLTLAFSSYFFIIGVARDAASGKMMGYFSFFAFLLIFVWSMATGARMGILSALFMYFSVWFMHSRVRRVNWYAFAFGALIMLLPFIFQVVNRIDGDGFSLAETTLMKYFVGPVFAFDQLIQTGEVKEITRELGRPGLFLLGFDTIVVSGFMRGILGLDVTSALSATSGTFHHGVQIAEGVVMNAHYTAGSKWYFDFGLVGYVAFYSILAAVCVYWDWLCSRTLSVFTLLFSGFVSLSVFYSSREFIFDSPAYIFCGLLLFATVFWVGRLRGMRAGSLPQTLNT